jgi:hypothetical protein
MLVFRARRSVEPSRPPKVRFGSRAADPTITSVRQLRPKQRTSLAKVATTDSGQEETLLMLESTDAEIVFQPRLGAQCTVQGAYGANVPLGRGGAPLPPKLPPIFGEQIEIGRSQPTMPWIAMVSFVPILHDFDRGQPDGGSKRGDSQLFGEENRQLGR